MQFALTAHAVPLGRMQLPMPSHWLPTEHVPVSVCPNGTLLQVPRLPATLQAWQVPVQLLLQQYPSTQFPFRQSLLDAQACPFSFRQLPVPSQETVDPLHIIVPVVSSEPTGTNEQVPSLPDTLQLWHVAVHVVLQQ